MSRVLCTGGVLRCNMGTTPSTFQGGCARTRLVGRPAGTVADHVPNRHVPPFGLCRSLANPSVASATSAAQGVLTPMPCVPVLASPWTPGAVRTRLEHKRALLETDTLACQWTGVISVQQPGQSRVRGR